MPDYQTHEHDVIVIGAGGAGLRAAIEASAAKVSVGLICKSLLGKAHTVMAEGGVAAALANVDDRDGWQTHFADTMRGGQYLNNWVMAEIHAKQAPDRVRELEAWGALFDRTADGRILQRNFGGHKYPRLAHVGDRTGLEMIRTLQDHGIHQGIEVYMEHTVTSLLMSGGRVVGCFGYDRERGRFRVYRAKAINELMVDYYDEDSKRTRRRIAGYKPPKPPAHSSTKRPPSAKHAPSSRTSAAPKAITSNR